MPRTSFDTIGHDKNNMAYFIHCATIREFSIAKELIPISIRCQKKPYKSIIYKPKMCRNTGVRPVVVLVENLDDKTSLLLDIQCFLHLPDHLFAEEDRAKFSGGLHRSMVKLTWPNIVRDMANLQRLC